MAEPEKETPHHTGHRARLRDRFLENGPGAIADYELLEMILGFGIPRRDVKPLAKQLIHEFGGFSGVLSAKVEELKEVKGLGETAIAAIKATYAGALRMGMDKITDKPVLSSWESVLDFCQTSMGYHKIEQFQLLFLDKKNRLIANEIQQQGTVDHTPAYPREIVKRALNLGASALILVHNHPSGDPKPSQADKDITKVIVNAAQSVGVSVHDHLIIAKGKYFSFRAEGLM